MTHQAAQGPSIAPATLMPQPSVVAVRRIRRSKSPAFEFAEAVVHVAHGG